MSALPPPVLAAALAAALAVPLLGWALLARPQDAAARARANLVRGMELPTPSGPGRGWCPGWPGP